MNAFNFFRARPTRERITVIEAPIPEAKRLLAKCTEAGIDATLGGKECCSGGGGCSPKAAVLVYPEDAPKVQALLQDEWSSLIERETCLDRELLAKVRAAAENPESGPYCPACGHQGAPVSGACGDCGLAFG